MDSSTEVTEEGEELSELFGSLKIEDLDSTSEEMYEALQNKLLSNPHHFSTWGHDIIDPPLQQWTLEDKKKLFEEFCEYFKTLRFSADQDFESYFGQLDKNFVGIQGATLFFVEAFIHTETGLEGWEERAIDCIRNSHLYTKLFIEDRDVKMDSKYIPGVVYLNRWTLLAMCLRQGKLPPDANPNDYDGEKEFELLPNKSKAVVLWAKVQFLTRFQWFIPKAREITFDAIRKIVNELDPKAYEWHYKLGNWLRCERRRLAGPDLTSPSEEEQRIFWETYNSCDYAKFDKENPSEESTLQKMALACVCQAIAEMIKYRVQVSKDYNPIQFGELVFNHTNEMVDFVLENVKRMMEFENRSYAELIRSGEIISNILPHEYRNYLLTEKYYLEAWKMFPHTSKINHKLGVLYYLSDELLDIPKAINYLKTAVEKERANFPATIDLINCLLSDANGNEEELEEFLSIRLDSHKYDLLLKDKQQLLFSYGCLKFLTGHGEDAIKKWIAALKEYPSNEFFLEKIQKTATRFRWKRKIPFTVVRAACTDFIAKNVEMTKEDKAALVKILELFPQISESRARRMPFHSESDADDNWRVSSSSASLEPIDNLPPTLQNASYIPPNKRGNNLTNLAETDNNKENRNQKYNPKCSRNNRFPSPDNWRT